MFEHKLQSMTLNSCNIRHVSPADPTMLSLKLHVNLFIQA